MHEDEYGIIWDDQFSTDESSDEVDSEDLGAEQLQEPEAPVAEVDAPTEVIYVRGPNGRLVKKST